MFAVSGVPPSKLNDDVSGLKHLLEKGNGSISVSHLRELATEVGTIERSVLGKELLNAGPAAIIFDGTTDVCEIAAVLVRWFDLESCKIQQRLVSAAFLQKSLNANELARHLVDMLQVRFSIPPQNVFAVIKDGAAVNGAAMRLLGPLLTNSTSIVCSSHTACLSGSLLGKSLKAACKFVSLWSQMMSKSNVARVIGKSFANMSTLRVILYVCFRKRVIRTSTPHKEHGSLGVRICSGQRDL
jgi:hypothetical protein